MYSTVLKTVIAGIILLVSSVATAGILSTTFNSNNGQAGNVFNIEILSENILITGFDLNIDSTSNIQVYTKLGGYQGFDFNSAGWDLIFSSSVISNGENVASFADITDTLFKANSTYGLYIVSTSANTINYTNGSTEGALYASNSDLKIFEGKGKKTNFTGNYSPRVWNGSIHYTTTTVAAVPEPTTIAMLALGLMGLVSRRVKR